jgi:hypothetical protein
MSWKAFLEKAANVHGLLEGDDREAFLSRFAEQNLQQSDQTVANNLSTSEVTLQRRLTRVYKVFARTCPELDIGTRGKFRVLRDWLKSGYIRYEETGELPWLPTTFNLRMDKNAMPSTLCQAQIATTSQNLGMSEDFYVTPPILNTYYNEILKPGCLLRVKAPWKMGKTELMSKVLNYAAEQGYRIAHLNLRDATTTDFCDLNQFLKWFCTSITISVIQEPPLLNPVEEHWNKSIGNAKNKCKTYFEKYLLPGGSPLALALDEVDQVFRYPKIASEFLGMLRTRHEDAKTRSIWGKLRQVLAYTEDYREIDINLSPFNAGIPIELPELSHEQIQELAQQYGLNLDSDQVMQLMDRVGGHPYLVQEAIKHMTQQNITLDELLVQAPTQARIYSEFLQRYWRRLQQSQELATAFHEVVMADLPVELHPDRADQLYNLGLVKFESNGVVPRYKLYRQYFCDRLGSPR